MKKYDKETAQAQLDNEKAVLKKLEGNYKDALDEINGKIAELMGRADADMQHVVYQVEYQKALRTQIEAILKTLQANKFETVSEYLTQCYDEGFLSTLYSIQKQGVPLVFPINQEEVATAIRHETNLSKSLYESFDMKDLQKKIAGEISRGFSTGALYSEITRNVASYAMIDKNKAMRIVRTEGHRITETAAANAQKKAKDRGADIVKIWDATLDGKTRPSHMRVDGEIKEIGKKFSNGLEFPGDPSGAAAEVINCRCRSRSDARWALEADETKMLGDVSKMSESRKQEIADKLGVPVDTLDQYSNQIVPVKAKDYADFKKQYDQIWRYEETDMYKEAEERIAGYGKSKESRMATQSQTENDWSKTVARTVTKEEKADLMQYAKTKGINVVDLKHFDGDAELLKSEINALSNIMKEFPTNKKVTVTVSNMLPDELFARTSKNTITFNNLALRNRKITEQNILNSGFYFASSTADGIAVHEYGHIFASVFGNKGIEITKKAYYNVTGKMLTDSEVLSFLESSISEYAVDYDGDFDRDLLTNSVKATKYVEIIPEVMAKSISDDSEFVSEFMRLLRG